MVIHGHPRFTADLDLAAQMDRENLQRLIGALSGLGYRPRAPVDANDFVEEKIREGWIRDKGLVVFTLWSPRFPTTEIDLFVKEPFDFEIAYERALCADLEGILVTVASIADLIALKRAAGRPRDLEDIEALEAIEVALNDK